MRRLIYYVGASLDGYISGPNGEVDFFPVSEVLLGFIRSEYPETIPTHLRAQMGFDAPNRRFDAVVMGRRTYDPALEVGVISPYAHLRQYVVSSTLEETAGSGVDLIRDDPLAAVARMKQEQGLDIWLAGGGTLAGALLPQIDELVVKRYPVVAGGGVPTFAAAFSPQAFAVAESRAIGDGTTVTTYVRVDG